MSFLALARSFDGVVTCQEPMQELWELKGHTAVCGLKAPGNWLLPLCEARMAEGGKTKQGAPNKATAIEAPLCPQLWGRTSGTGRSSPKFLSPSLPGASVFQLVFLLEPRPGPGPLRGP